MSEEEIVEKYGDVELKFHSYYKYSFMYKGMAADGCEVLAWVGGDHNDIYKMDISIDDVESLKSLWPNLVQIKRDGEEVASFNNY